MKKKFKKRDLPGEITSKILKAMESVDSKDWKMPWHGGHGGFPRNVQTNQYYHGINIMWLWMYEHPSKLYAGFAQWKKMGAHVKKNETGIPVLVYKPWEKEVDGETEKGVYMAYKTVFAAEQAMPRLIENFKAAGLLDNDNMERFSITSIRSYQTLGYDGFYFMKD